MCILVQLITSRNKNSFVPEGADFKRVVKENDEITGDFIVYLGSSNIGFVLSPLFG